MVEMSEFIAAMHALNEEDKWMNINTIDFITGGFTGFSVGHLYQGRFKII